MKVKDIMTHDPRSVTPDTTVAAAAHLMWEADCGILPVVENGQLTGVVTDRDLYIALATRNALPSSLTVGEAATRNVTTCTPEDDVHAAMETMKQARVRRLPVVGFGNAVMGILSMDDIVLAAGVGKPVRGDEVLDVLQVICRQHRPVPHVTAE